MTLREPVGVVAAIVPWNAPLLLSAQKVAPALAAGCTVVLKPSEYATFAVLRLVELIEEAGLPAGRAQRRHRTGRPDRRGADHPPADRQDHLHRQPRRWAARVMAAAAAGIKRVALELGGKSPALVFADAPTSSSPPRPPWAR